MLHIWTISACSILLWCMNSPLFAKTFSQILHLISFFELSEVSLWRNQQRLSPNTHFPEGKFQQTFTLSLWSSFLCCITILFVWKVSAQNSQACSVTPSFEHGMSADFKLSSCFFWWCSRSDSDLHHFPHISHILLYLSLSTFNEIVRKCGNLVLLQNYT